LGLPRSIRGLDSASGIFHGCPSIGDLFVHLKIEYILPRRLREVERTLFLGTRASRLFILISSWFLLRMGIKLMVFFKLAYRLTIALLPTCTKLYMSSPKRQSNVDQKSQIEEGIHTFYRERVSVATARAPRKSTSLFSTRML
jgi:hypothetical protein